MTPRAYGVTVRRSAPLRLPMHHDAPDQGEWRTWAQSSERPIAIDLFSGAGGLSQGLEAAGYRVALAVDIDPWALETHVHNFAGRALGLDLASDADRDAVVGMFDGIAVDLVAGGPPCQPFSRAGRSKIRSLVELGARDEVDLRKELWRAFLDVVERISPRSVLMENVPDMALGDDTIVLRQMLDRLETLGYEVDARIVDTWVHGVPQHRQRLILVGVRDGGAFQWPDPVDPVTVRDAIGDLPVLDVEADSPIGAETLPYDDRGASDFARRARKQCAGDSAVTIHDHLTRAVRADDLEAFRLMTSGTLYSDLPDEMKRYRDDIFDDKYNRLGWDDYSRSITAHIAKDGYWYIHPDQHRTLTVREAARVQTFPDNFRFAGSRSHQFHQIGNAVPPALAEAIGDALIEACRGPLPRAARPSVRRGKFRTSLREWAKTDRERAPWEYPGEPWQVAVGLILGSKGGSAWPAPADVLRLAPGFSDATPSLLSAVATMSTPGRRRDAAERLCRVADSVRADTAGWEGQSWMKAANLGPANRTWYGLLAGETLGLVASTAVLRVTARVTGTDVDRQNRLSAGRMELAKLVGAGDDAALLNAALHRLGSTVCLPDEPLCRLCPVRSQCAGRPT